MKAITLGAGPAGLYCSLLLKKIRPDLDITILERNPHDATYGWGVVFSDQTLNAFREADYPSFKAITGQFVIWDAIDVKYQSQLIRCGGHVFGGMSRRKLLLILQERCKEVGVKLKFNVEITDPAEFTGYDLIIAADGVNSITRKTYEHAFKPTLELGKSKFVWYGTDKVFDSFTFIFRENEHGLFQVHAYPFDGTTSTFIVECEEATWRRAGLDQAGEAESMAYCERLFAQDLGHHRLLSNRSLWINFLTVKNKTWHHHNLVLMGDAAHTAHFSVGSGTKLAMEDAIAFANAFEQHGEKNLQAVFNDYEAERRPRVEGLQAAAWESSTYFEHVKRYFHLEPLQFTFHLLTRSGRISYDNLRLRDPYFSETIDCWFATATPMTPAEAQTELVIAAPPMFTPLKLRDVTLTNRVALMPASSYAAREGLPGDIHLNQLLRRAKGGAALVLTELTAVSVEGRITPGCAGLYRPEHMAAWKRIVDCIHSSSSAKVGLQLNHAGRRGSTRPRREGLDRPLRQGNWTLVSASPLPYTPENQTPQEMSRTDMDKVRHDYVEAAGMAQEAGFDLLQLQFGHGYLLASFISPLTNLRTDDYGGDLENRLRFPLEIFKAVREIWPEPKPLSVAIPATDWAKNGFDIDEATVLAERLKTLGCDMVEILAGQTVLETQPVYDPYFLVPFSEQIRNQVHITTLVSGGLTTTDQINSILAGGRADLCLMDPPALRHSE
jgi:anthraniloyl-CoA monooxygenase